MLNADLTCLLSIRQVVDMTAGNALASMMDDVGSTQFTGYGGLQAQGRIVALLRDGKPVDEAEEGGPSAADPSLWCILWRCTSIQKLHQAASPAA